MYSLAIYLYALCVHIASLFSSKARKMIRGQKQTMHILRTKISPEDYVVWFHAASLGEFEQGRPMMERLRRLHPEYKILLTFFSPSGCEVCRDYEGADVVCYLPFDTPRNARSFVESAHPQIAVFVKYEFWTNYLVEARSSGTKIYSVNSIFRPDQYLFKWSGGKKTLGQFEHLFVQNEDSRRLLAEHDIKNVTVVGDTRFDRVLDIKNTDAAFPDIEKFVGTDRCVILGSSCEQEEKICIPYFAKHKDTKLIIAPHDIRKDHVLKIRKQLEKYLTDKPGCASRGMIIDCIGILSSIYRYASVAVIGGGFGVGIHNVAEAAVYGIPVLFGPNNKKFKEAQDLKTCGGAFEFKDAESFALVMDCLLADDEALRKAGHAAGEYIYNNVGATDECFTKIFSHLSR